MSTVTTDTLPTASAAGLQTKPKKGVSFDASTIAKHMAGDTPKRKSRPSAGRPSTAASSSQAGGGKRRSTWDPRSFDSVTRDTALSEIYRHAVTSTRLPGGYQKQLEAFATQADTDVNTQRFLKHNIGRLWETVLPESQKPSCLSGKFDFDRSTVDSKLMKDVGKFRGQLTNYKERIGLLDEAVWRNIQSRSQRHYQSEIVQVGYESCSERLA